MKNGSKKTRKSLVIGVITAVVLLAVLLAVLMLTLTQCGGEQTAQPTQTTAEQLELSYDLYWNVDREEFDGKSEAGMSSRKLQSDGYFHVRFFKDGEMLELRVADRKVVNAIDINDLMGLEFDQDGVVTGVIPVEDMPCERLGWLFYVQSTGGNLIKLNSSKLFNGLEVLLEIGDQTRIYDMTGVEGTIGKEIMPSEYDRVIAIANLEGELTHVFICDRSEYMNTYEGECQHCQQTVTWREYTKTDTLPTVSGHYILQNDVNIKGGQVNLAEDSAICLDLNGKQVTSQKGGRMIALFNPGCKLAIMDTSAEQTGTIKASGEGNQGLCVWLRYGEFHLYSGTLDASDAKTTTGGTAVGIDANTYMYMYGGTIIGGEAPCIYYEDRNIYNRGIGGAMLITGKFVMNGGEIRDGRATSIVTYNAKGQAVYNRGFGGNIYANGSATLELNGGVIKNGYAGRCGGNLYLDGSSEAVLNGTVIQGGRIDGRGTNGGSVYVGTKASLTMNSGSITGGVSRNEAGNIYSSGTVTMKGGYIGGGAVWNFDTGKLKEDCASRNVFSVNGTLTIYGGTIAGGVHVIDTSKTDARQATVVLAGSPIIDGGENTKANLTLSTAGGGVKVTVGKLGERARIGVTATTGIFTEKTDEANADNFFSDIGGEVVHYQEKLALGKLGCICGSESHFGACDGTQQLWIPHNKTNTLPVTAGYWFLTEDVALAGQQNIKGLQDIALDLNGHTVTTKEGQRAYALFDEKEPITLTLTDSSEEKTGAIKAVGTDVQVEGQCIWIRTAGQTVNLYDVTLDASQAVSGRRGAALYANAGTTVNMYAGRIVGGTAQAVYRASSKTVVNGMAGNVYTNGTFHMYGGVISGGKALSALNESKTETTYVGGVGGNFAAGSQAEVDLLGGTIEGGHADSSGGNLYFDGTQSVRIAGTQILNGTVGNAERKLGGSGGNLSTTGNVAVEASSAITGGVGLYNTNGGNIYVGTKGSLTLSGATVSGGKAERGGNIAAFGTLKLTKATVTGGSAGTGGNVFLYGAKAAATITDSTLEKGTATANGGNIHIGADGASLVLSGTALSGGSAVSGGNLSMSQKTAVQLKSGTVTGGIATNGGNIYAAGGSLTLGGSTVEKGTATNGGNVYLHTGISATMSAGTVSGGKAKDGGNIYVYSGAALTLSGGTVEKGCVTKDGAGNIDVRGTFTMTGGTVSGGYRVNEKGEAVALSLEKRNIFAYKSNVTISGGKVDGGVLIHTNETTLTLSKDACIASSEEGKPGLTLNAGALITLDGTLSDKASVIISNGENTQLTSGGSKTALASDRGLLITAASDGSLWLRGHTHCSAGCGGINGEHAEGCTGSDEGWKLWSGGTITESGSYCLHTEDTLTLKTQVTIGSGLDVTVCLNGKTLSASARAFLIKDGGSLTVMDCAGGGVIEGKGNDKDSGAVICIIDGTLDLHAGTVRQLTDENVTVSGGGAVRVDAKSEMNLYGGSVIGGTVTGAGGAIRTAGTLNIFGGSVSGGTAASGGAIGVTGGTVTMNAGTITGGTAANGGNVHVAGGSFTLTGGTITGGTATTSGGNVGVAKNAQFTLSGGSVETGKMANVDGAGNIDVRGTFTMTGGSVSGGHRVNDKGETVALSLEKRNIFAVNGTLELSGGEIDGGVMVHTAASTLKVSKDARIVSNEEGKPGLTLNAGALITLEGTLNSGASIVLSNGADTQIASGSAKTALSSDKGLLVSAESDGKLYLRTHTHCTASCGEVDGRHAQGCTGLDVSGWTVWNGGNITKNGKYCLHNEITVDTPAGISASDVTLLIDGKLSSSKRTLMVSAGAKLTLQGEGIVEGKGVNGENTGVVTVSGQLNLQGVTLRQTADESITINNGGVLTVAASGVVIMDSGFIQGGSAGNGGGNVFVNGGSFTMNGGTIQNGTAGVGGNVFVYQGSFTMADDGDDTTTPMIAGGHATKQNGGNVYVQNTGAFTVANGQITGGYNTGNIHVAGIMHMSGGLITGGNSTVNGANVYVAGTLNMEGGSIEGGTSTLSGANVYVAGTMNMEGGSIKDGTMNNADGAGNVHVAGTLNMSGGWITGGHRVNAQGVTVASSAVKRNVFVYGGTVNMSGGQIDGGVQVYRQTSTLKLSGDPTIATNEEGKPSLSLTAWTDGVVPVITVGKDGLSGEANIVLSGAAAGAFAVSEDTTPLTHDMKKAFDDNDDGFITVGGVEYRLTLESDNKLYLRAKDAHVHCLCGRTDGTHAEGCGGWDVYYTAWEQTDSLPDNGAYYLNEQDAVTLSKQHWVGQQNSTDYKDLTLCLNGKTVQTASTATERVIMVWTGSKMTLTDCGTSGTVRAGSAVTQNGGTVHVAGTFNLMKGTITGGKSTASGANVYVAGTMNMAGGTISNGVMNNKDGAGNVHVAGTLNMSGGWITGGHRVNAQGVTVTSSAVKRNVFVYGGTVNMSGGQIDGGVQVYRQTSTLKLSGDPTIATNEEGKPSLSLTAWTDGVMPVIVIGKNGLSDASIRISAPAQNTVFAKAEEGTLAAGVEAFFSHDGGYAATLENNQLLFK